MMPDCAVAVMFCLRRLAPATVPDLAENLSMISFVILAMVLLFLVNETKIEQGF
ncbi:hypothetical protein MKJ01_01040 [Chryseobacterium sp. SSA4.19]|uniref:hypothetical protein n=1 Tax=Chryseobacterium sp. SSA4.19 TaxID=2919915 RepID=UPI001F4DD086|nr:hypothetical protein [Chryseobacterium sp. SSA4.19]MCJ8152342.1 hypothetical protein [Chryseobacterium sp. SSA4.19]